MTRPGSEGAGVADVLIGDKAGKPRRDFQGRLSFSLPRRPDQTPLNVGDRGYDPQSAYGYGLSYAGRRRVGTLAEARIAIPTADRGVFVQDGGVNGFSPTIDKGPYADARTDAAAHPAHGRAGGIGLALGATPGIAGAARATPGWPLGVQLWSVDAELKRDFDVTLRRLAALGYKRVESAGLHGRTPAAFRRAVDAAGMRCDSAHVSMPDLHAYAAGRIAQARDSGVDWLVCSSPLTARPLKPGMDWMRAVAKAMTLDAWKRNAALLNAMAVRARAAGLGFAYHNHPVEFGRYEGRQGFDVLLAQTDPSLVRFELDVAWAAAGGRDPAALLREHPRRFALLHVKDLKARSVPGRIAHRLGRIRTSQVRLPSLSYHY